MWRAFWAVTKDRPIGFGGVGQIPFSAVDRYANRYRIVDLDEFDRFAELIDRMDAEYIRIVNKPKTN